MSASLTTLITNTQAALGDTAGTYFTSDIVTAGIRAALTEINERAPIHAAELIDVIADQKEYELSDYDESAMAISDVLLKDTDREDDEPLSHDQYSEDERLFFRLRDAQASGTLICRYTKPQTINGLDSETSSTLAAWMDKILIYGAAYHCCIIRSVARVEANNMDTAASDNYREAAAEFRKLFDTGLLKLSNKKPAVSEPDTAAWNDEYHGGVYAIS